MAAKALKVLRAGRQCVKQVKARIAAARALALVAIEAYHDRRQRILFCKLGCRNTDNALMPVLAGEDYRRFGCRAGHHFRCIIPDVRLQCLTAAV